MDAIQQRLNTAVNAMLEKIDKEKVRPITKESYLKMAACYDLRGASAQDIQNCVQGTSRRMEAINNIIQSEMGQLQNRLERCSMGCQDEVRDKMAGKDNTPANMAAAEKIAMDCTTTCVDKHIALLKSVQYKIETDIKTAVERY